MTALTPIKAPSGHVDIAVSTLIMNCDPRRAGAFGDNLFGHLAALFHSSGLRCSVLLRINASAAWTGQDALAETRAAIEAAAEAHGVPTVVMSEGFNLGFGAGHNANLKDYEAAAYFLVNDDILFPNLDFLEDAFHLLGDGATRVGIVGAAGSPGRVNPDLGSSFMFARDSNLAQYVDGALFLVSREAWRAVGGFDPAFGYAYFEDVDLSFRLRAAGWKAAFVDMPHAHARSQTSTGLAPGVYARLYEHNRAVFMSRWRDALSAPEHEPAYFVDLSAHGLGDLADFYYPFRQFVRAARRSGIRVAVKLAPEKLRFLFENLDVEIVDERPSDVRFANAFTLVGLNFSVPFRMLDVAAAALGVSDLDVSPDGVRSYLDQGRAGAALAPFEDDYAVVHLDSERLEFHGRAMRKSSCIAALEVLRSRFRIVIVGKHDVAPDDAYEQWLASNAASVVDRRDQGSIEDMVRLIGQSSFFFGIDSGPMHFAQLLDVPSLVMFGSVHPMAKIYRQHNTVAYTHPDLDCVGCYHRFVDPGYNFCLRTDQACVNEVDEPRLLELLHIALDGVAGATWIDHQDGWSRLQRDHLRLQIHNPLFKSKLLVPAGPQKDVSDALLLALDAITERSEMRRREVEARLSAELDTANQANRSLREEFRRLAARTSDAAAAAPSTYKKTGLAALYDTDLTSVSIQGGSFFDDGWLSGEILMRFRPKRPLRAISIVGWSPKPNVIRVTLNGMDFESRPIEGEVRLDIETAAELGDVLDVGLSFETIHSYGNDQRRLGMILTRIETVAGTTP